MLLASLASVIIDGESTCPTAARVSEQLATLARHDPRRATPDRAHLREHGDVVEVELVSGTGRSLVRRPFKRATSCDELALAIAVVIATWEADLVGNEPVLTVPAPPLPSPADRTQLELAAAAFGSMDRAGWAAGGTAEVDLARPASPWSLRVGLLGQTTRQVPFGPGSVGWARDAVTAGVRYGIGSLDSFSLELGVDAGLGIRTVSGSGFEVDRSAYGLDPAASARVRLYWNHDAWAAFADASELAWISDDHLDVTGLSQGIELPRFELHLGLGVLWRAVKGWGGWRP